MFNLGRPGGVPLKLEFDVLLSHKAKYFVAVAVLALMLPAAGAQLSRMKLSDLKRMRADNMNFVDNNIVVSGNVYLPFGDMEVYADKAVINASTWDVEATGNIQFYRWVSMTGNIDTDKLARLERASNILVSVKGIMGDIWGDQLIQVEASGLTDNIRAQRMVGNMETGYFQFENFEAQYNTFICKAGVGERRPDGKIVVKKAEISACNYLLNDNAHYSISCGEATLIPQNTSFYGYGTCPFSTQSITEMILKGRDELHRQVDALRRLGGVWRNIVLLATSEQLGIREGRRIHGRETVTGDHLKGIVKTECPVCRITAQPDIHAPDPNRGSGIVKVAFRCSNYDIPWGALLSADRDNLLMAGRCISGDFIAHSSYRMSGNAVPMGEAAGIGAALAVQMNCLPPEVPFEAMASQIEL